MTDLVDAACRVQSKRAKPHRSLFKSRVCRIARRKSKFKKPLFGRIRNFSVQKTEELESLRI
jgi:hypothetical protein